MQQLASSLETQPINFKESYGKEYPQHPTDVSSLNLLRIGNKAFLAPVQVDSANPKNNNFLEQINCYSKSILTNIDVVKDMFVTHNIAAFLLCLGYTVPELVATIDTQNFGKLLTDHTHYQPFLVTLDKQAKYQYSFTNSDPFFNWSRQQITAKFDHEFITFAELHTRAQHSKAIKNINLIVLNITTNKFEIFNYKNTPALPLALAMRICASGLTAFSPVEIIDLQQNTANAYLDSSILLQHLNFSHAPQNNKQCWYEH